MRLLQVAEYSLRKGLITKEDALDNAPYLYLGLPALTLVEALIRSLGTE